MKEIVDKVLGFGLLELVIFTGGEPFLFRDDLLTGVKYCSELGLKTRIVTNAFWAHSANEARTMVSRCIEAGLSEINISCDDYHQQFIPIANVKYANDACRELGLPALIGHKYVKGGKLTLELLEKLLGHQLVLFQPEKENPPNDIVITGYNVPIASDMDLIPDAEILYPENDVSWQTPCHQVLQQVIFLR